MDYKSVIYGLILTAALVVGTAFAQTSWQDPSANPPGCAAGDLGCYQPLNVSSVDQIKKGGLWLDGNLISRGWGDFGSGVTVFNNLNLNIGSNRNSVESGYVLTAKTISQDPSGRGANIAAEWAPAGAQAGEAYWRKGELCGGIGSFFSGRATGQDFDGFSNNDIPCYANGQEYRILFKASRGFTEECPAEFKVVGTATAYQNYFLTCVCTDTNGDGKCGTKN